jgi:hypothetical protein
MASVILNVVGTALGGPIGGAIGAIIGAAIDSQIVRAITPNQTQRIEGPRLNDVKVTTSTEGMVIPRVYGTMRVGGNIVWATDFREEVRTTTQRTGGGKGGGGGGATTVTTEYFYYCSFAVALCEGPIAAIGRIWADGKPFDVPGAVYRVYRGTEDQGRDPLIASMMGADNTPAYRGTAYVVFDNLPLEKFGNRIPQLSFEVFRPLDDPESAEQLVKSVTMIPSAGEFVYATEPIVRREVNALSGMFVRDVSENVHSTDGRPDFTVSLDQLAAIAPNLQSVALVVSWFGTDLRCGQCLIVPGVETAEKITYPKAWTVNGIDRSNAHVVSQYQGGPAYGGTPADFAVVQAIQALKAHGLRVTFYPFVLMDIPHGNSLPNPYSDNAAASGQPAYPWRGRITCSPAPGYAGSPDKTASAAAQVNAFFGNAQPSHFLVSGTNIGWVGPAGDWGFRRMILHYAHLCAAAGGVDAFLIGSELRGLTHVRSSASAYPTVSALQSLASAVRSVLGGSTKISYAADWSEYFGHHPQDGSGDVYFHLDPLWADSNIDFVGIDNYMPLSDWRDGFSHADAVAGWRSIYDRDYLESNIEGGEGFDWYYANPYDRDAQNRTPITDGAGKPWEFRYKDIRSWWSNQHFNRPGGIESGSPTAWVPQSKPIRFTEAGCPAIDKGTNQPNVFVDPKSSESNLPYYSRGARDDFIQRRYIEALYHYWSANNPTSSAYGGPMIELGELSIWTWDARPYPAFPARSDVWGDTENWRLGHWLNGRLGSSGLGALVRELCRRGGMADAHIDVAQLAATVPGYLIEAIESPRGSIEPLARFYGFDAVESDGAIRFIPRGLAPVVTIAPSELVAAQRRENDDIEFTRSQETELPLALKWRLIQAGEEYKGMTVEARRITVDTARIRSENFSIATAGAEADTRCRRALFESWIEREQAKFALPPSRIALDPADVVLIEHDGRLLEVRIGIIADTDARTIDAVRTDAVLYGARPGAERTPSVPAPIIYGLPTVALMDLPLINGDVPAHRPYIAVHSSPWYGRAAVYRSVTQDGFTLLDTVDVPSRIGVLAFDFYASGAAARNFDLGNELYIDLISGTLQSVTDIELFAGANTAAIESAPGVWEIVQFGEAELIDTNRYRCRRLLRGQLGTEGAMGNPAPAGSRVVILDSTVTPLSIAEADVGIAFNWRIGPASLAPDVDSYAAAQFAPAAIGLRPYAVGHVSQPYKFARQAGDLTISWVRRTRSPAGDNWAAAEAPLFEDSEAYAIEILDGAIIKRTLTANTAAVIYTGAQQIADWGALLGPGDTLDIAIYQLSAVFGRGAPKTARLFF